MIVVQGGPPLQGSLPAVGAKNAALPAIFASLLTDNPVVLENVPRLHDVDTAVELVRALGKEVELAGNTLTLVGGDGVAPTAPEELVRRMRASFLALGPTLARAGEAAMPLPGGCAIGARPVDLHLKGLAALGAELEIRGGTVHARASRLRGATVYLDYPSVGATEQLLLAGALAAGELTVLNPAREPEVVDLGRLLTAMGAPVRWEQDRVMVAGTPRLRGATHRVIPDRIETGTCLLAGAVTGGSVEVVGVDPPPLAALLVKLAEAGLAVDCTNGRVKVTAQGRPRAVDVESRPYPGFPTDLQPPMVTLLAVAAGEALVRETVFEARFGHVAELRRMGARLRLQGNTLAVEGVARLVPARVRATDIRAGAALVLAGLVADGRTEVEGEEHVHRGYQDLPGRLRALGGHVWQENAASSH
ncbi:MAG: UDP-N-acetylglucosamine 1-carboxyvinyltransferase [Candidatus Bipolaricaulaceae bacterium]